MSGPDRRFAKGKLLHALVLGLLVVLAPAAPADRVFAAGPAQMQAGDLAKALDYFERALAINPNMDGVRDAIDAIGRVLAERRKRYI